MRSRRFFAAAFAAFLLFLALSSIFVINEGEQALVVRLGAPIRGERPARPQIPRRR